MTWYPLFRRRPSLAARIKLDLPRDAKEWPRGKQPKPPLDKGEKMAS